MGILCKETEENKIKTFFKKQQTNEQQQKQKKHAAPQEQTNFHSKTKHFQYTRQRVQKHAESLPLWQTHF